MSLAPETVATANPLVGPGSESQAPAERALLLIIAVILLCTLFPYEFFADTSPSRIGPLFGHDLLGQVEFFDVIANVLLFLPLGFGVAWLARGRRWRSTTALALVISSVLSFTVEFLQVYLPERDPSLIDVITNTAGGLLGSAVFHFWGSWIVAMFSRSMAVIRNKLQRIPATPVLVAFLVYLGAACTASIYLQRELLPSDWDRRYPLVVGSETAGEFPWVGRVETLAIADRALPELARIGVTPEVFKAMQNSFVGSYFLTGPGPYLDVRGNLQALNWNREPQQTSTQGQMQQGTEWLQTSGPAAMIAERIRGTRQFTLSLVCAPANTTQHGPATIVSFSRDQYHRNFGVAQDSDALVIWFRTVLSGREAAAPYLQIPRLFTTTATRHLLLTFDGAELAVFVDGKRQPHPMVLNAGVGFFARLFALERTHVKSRNLRGYGVLYYTLIFLPLGLLLALLSGEIPARWRAPVLIAGLCLPSSFLELVLVRYSGKPFSYFNLCLGIVIATLGFWLCQVVIRPSTRRTAQVPGLPAEARTTVLG